MTTFTLLHGAWHGAWCWDAVAALLRGRGHQVTCITQTGLGERAAELSADITLQVFVDDVVAHLVDHDLTDVVLVGHSFGGNGITGAAAVVPERIRELVYLDAMITPAGKAPFDVVPPDVVDQRVAAAMAFSGGLSMPCPKPEAFGVTDPDQAAWVEARLTPHPLKTYQTPLTYDGPPGNGLPARYIMVTDPIYPPLASSRDRARALGWPMQEIATGHDAMITAPDALADLLAQGHETTG